ncbi:MAG: cupredoxin domain-containing protein [Pseudomonadota bacterium]
MGKCSKLVILAACCQALIACAGKPANSITVTTGDFHFTPTSWTVLAGKPLTLTIINEGSASHEWVLLKKGVNATPPFTEDHKQDVYTEVDVQPGEKKLVTFTAPAEPGTYDVICGMAGHLENGMRATLVVE